MLRRLALILAALSCMAPVAAATADDDGVLIVQLSLFATMGKCVQSGLEFTEAEWSRLAKHFQTDQMQRSLTRSNRSRLWGLALGLSEQSITSASCAKARVSINAWMPDTLPDTKLS